MNTVSNIRIFLSVAGNWKILRKIISLFELTIFHFKLKEKIKKLFDIISFYF